jgi:hypothetical protein
MAKPKVKTNRRSIKTTKRGISYYKQYKDKLVKTSYSPLQVAFALAVTGFACTASALFSTTSNRIAVRLDK